ncbi:class I SAM-dependent methyltransferase [Burkholderia metallica]|uniref:class I SAM-dependent methyltransferase n=1 Tax=Burkholderia metallica TaxID=488729 RepID=UPI0015759415|nr:class I SAM-dependent methyltransferase [Burkholderia metallica]NTZ04930.1 class I SAM-dependent methyltransferase [Burkholderia metallica]
MSWHQAHAACSLDLIRATGVCPDAPVIDVGGGASTLVDDLLALGFHDLSVLDLSGEALAVARRRLDGAARAVDWIEGDITSIALPPNRFAVWHDRAVFHFLTDPCARAAYVAQVRRAVTPGGHVIVATFATDGPTACSGLPVARYDAGSLHRAFGTAFKLIRNIDEIHVTPAGTEQHFVYCHFRHEAMGGRDHT